MICKNCGYKNEENAKFCEQCGSQIKHKEKEEKTTKKSVKIFDLIVILIILIAAFLGPVCKHYQNNYYKAADEVKSNMSFNGQFIHSINVNDYNCIELEFADNNFDNVIDDSLIFQDYTFYWETNCLAYDPDADDYSFVEYSPEKDGIRYGAIKESFYYNQSEFPAEASINCYDISFQENEIYKFTFSLYLAPKDNYGTALRKLCYRIMSNDCIANAEDFFTEDYTTCSYFVYENGEFKAIYPNEVSSEYVNAVWNGDDLYLIKYDEDGNCYSQGPVKTREDIQTD